MKKLSIGILREAKTPPDRRVPLTPSQCAYLLDKYDLQIVVQPSERRCFTDEEYKDAGILLQKDLTACDVLMGIKEVPIELLHENKTYLFFSHTIRKQTYNRKLLQSILQKNIRLIDYEVLTDERGERLIAFGKFAGMVGAHNGLMAYAWRTKSFAMPRMKDFHDYEAAKDFYRQELRLPPVRIVLTGTGRVASGAVEVLNDMGIVKVSPSDFLQKTFPHPVYTQLACEDYVTHKEKNTYQRSDFYANPQDYKSIFAPYTRVTDIMLNGIYWDTRSPAFFTKEDMKRDDFHIQVIADITCDIAPVSSIPSTLFATTIADPLFGYDVMTEQAVAPHAPNTVDMMTIDNLPSELPRDASQYFGEQFINNILDELLELGESPLIKRATMTENGKLTEPFQYLQDYVTEQV